MSKNEMPHGLGLDLEYIKQRAEEAKSTPQRPMTAEEMRAQAERNRQMSIHRRSGESKKDS